MIQIEDCWRQKYADLLLINLDGEDGDADDGICDSAMTIVSIYHVIVVVNMNVCNVLINWLDSYTNN